MAQPNPLRLFRILQIIIPGVFLLLGLGLVAAGALGGLILIGFALLAFSLFQWRLRSHQKTVTRVRAGLEELGRVAFDAPVSVEQRGPGEQLETLTVNRAFGAMIAQRSSRFLLRGRSNGREVELGTAIIAARDFDQLVSYALAIDPAPRAQFVVMTRGVLAKIARMGVEKHPVTTGDEAFDERWLVDGDEARCKAILDDDLRAKLLELHRQVGRMQIASLESTSSGVIVRFPGELSPAWAAHLRDLAFTLHDRIAALP